MAVARVRGLFAVSRVNGRAAGGLYVHKLATCQRVLGKFHLATRKSKEGMISTHSYKVTRMEPCAALPDDDVSWYHLLQQRNLLHESRVGIK